MAAKCAGRCEPETPLTPFVSGRLSTAGCCDVTHRLQAGADRLKTIQPQQVQGGCPQRGQRSGTVAPVAMGVLMALGVGSSASPSGNSGLASGSAGFLVWCIG